VRSQGHWKSGPLMGMVLGLSGGAVTWAVLFVCYPVFQISEELANLPTPAPIEDLERAEAAMIEANGYNAVFAVGLLGAVVAATMAIGEGIAQGSIVKALIAAAACAFIGALAGCLTGWLGHVVLQACRPVEDLTPLARTIRVQGVMLATVGAGIGLGIGVMLGRRARTTVICPIAGGLAGVFAGMLYPFLTAVLLPNVRTEILIPAQIGNHFLWLGLTTGLLGLTVFGLAKQPAGKQERRAAVPETTE